MTALALGLIVVCLFITCVAALAAKALRDFSRHELEQILKAHRSEPDLGDVLVWHERAALSAECLEILAALAVVMAADAWRHTARAAPPGVWEQLGFILVLALALVAAAVWIPRSLTRIGAAWFVYYTWGFWRLTSVILFPLTAGAAVVDRVIQAVTGRRPQVPDEESLEAEIRTIVTEGHREGLLENEAREMIEGVMLLDDADVSQVMVPRIDMVCLHVGTSLDVALRFVVESGHSRIPVYDKSRDDVVGVLHLKDLLAATSEKHEADSRGLAELVRPPQFVPETKPLDELLRDLRRTRNHLAVVLDEYGGVSGLVTMEDVLEEIVGEIADETDTDKDATDGIRVVDERTTDVAARVHVDQLNQRLGLSLPEDQEFDTIGGWVFTELGRVPRVGEVVTWNNVKVTVLEVSRRRVEKVRVEIVAEPQGEPAA